MNSMRERNQGQRQEGNELNLHEYFIENYEESKRTLIDDSLYLEECDRRVAAIQESIDEARARLPGVRQVHIQGGIEDRIRQDSIAEQQKAVAAIKKGQAEINEIDFQRRKYVVENRADVIKTEKKIEDLNKLRAGIKSQKTREELEMQIAALKAEVEMLEDDERRYVAVFERHVEGRKNEIEAAFQKLENIVEDETIMRTNASNLNNALRTEMFVTQGRVQQRNEEIGKIKGQRERAGLGQAISWVKSMLKSLIGLESDKQREDLRTAKNERKVSRRGDDGGSLVSHIKRRIDLSRKKADRDRWLEERGTELQRQAGDLAKSRGEKRVSGMTKAERKERDKFEKEKREKRLQERTKIVDDYPAPRREFYGSDYYGKDAWDDMRDDLLFWRNSNLYNMICFVNKLRKEGRFKKKAESEVYELIKQILDGKESMSLNWSIYMLEERGVKLKEISKYWYLRKPYEDLAKLLRELKLNVNTLLRCKDITEFTTMLAEAEAKKVDASSPK